MTEPTSTEIAAQINALQNPQPQPQVTPAQADNSTPAQAGQVNEVKPEGQVSSEPANAGQVEPKPAENITFNDLQKKTGVIDADALAKSFVEAQKKITQLAQENAKLKTPESGQPPQIESAPQVDKQTEYNQRFVQDLSVDPLGTIAKLASAIADVKLEAKLRPYEQQNREDMLNKEVIKLATSPDTSNTFNLPEVHEEMKKVCEENPEYLENLPKNLAKIHDLALGRMSRKGFVVKVKSQVLPGQNPVSEGGAMKLAPAPQAFDVKKASSAEIEAHINSLQK